MSDVVIFLGPSLTWAEAGARLAADYRPPVKRGDLLPLLETKPPFVGIVDGAFFQRLSISTKEILLLLDAGVTVFGAASMGALRALELAPEGMIGVGRIFELYRDGRIDADDEVAMAFDPETLVAQSEPLANLRLTLADARAAGILTPREEGRLLLSAKRTYFPERTVARLLGDAERWLPEGRFRELRARFDSQTANVKRLDALALLDAVASRLASA